MFSRQAFPCQEILQWIGYEHYWYGSFTFVSLAVGFLCPLGHRAVTPKIDDAAPSASPGRYRVSGPIRSLVNRFGGWSFQVQPRTGSDNHVRTRLLET
jgi:hypothetical protein